MNSSCNNIKISIFCLTFNHEKYIRQCLQSLVEQKTDFDYEILVHNDASTDSTLKIANEYQEKYPDKVKVINQTENQYSKGIRIISKYLLPVSQGKYLAWCEGDDYWCDAYKLQKQFTIMEKNPNCNLCIAKVQAISEEGIKLKKTFPKFKLKSGIIEKDDFINEVVSDFSFHLSGILLKRDGYIEYNKNLPEYASLSPVPDLALFLYFGQLGEIYFLDDIVSCYRLQAIGSWTSNQKTKSIEEQDKYENKLIEMMKYFNIYTDQKYISYCSNYILNREFNILRRNRNYNKLLNKKFYYIFKRMSTRRKIAIYAQNYCMHIYNFFKKFF